MTLELGGVISSVIVLLAVISSILVLAFDRYRARSLDFLRNRVKELNAALDTERDDRVRDQRRCDERVSRMEGHVEAVTGPFAKQIVDAVREEVRVRGVDDD